MKPLDDCREGFAGSCIFGQVYAVAQVRECGFEFPPDRALVLDPIGKLLSLVNISRIERGAEQRRSRPFVPAIFTQRAFNLFDNQGANKAGTFEMSDDRPRARSRLGKLLLG